MKVNFEKCPVKYEFFSRDEKGRADIHFKGSIEDKGEISHILKVRVFSMTSCLAVAEYFEENAGESFDFKLSVPCGYNYRVCFEIVRTDNEEWIDFTKSFSHISVGDVFVIAGQSNAVGYGRGTYENIPDMRIHNFRLSDEWAIASHPLNDLDGYKGSIARDLGEYSQHITMAKKLITHTGVPVAFIPCAVGGTEIARWNKRYKGDLYEDMIRRVKKAGLKISGLFWCQGSSDANSEEKSLRYYNALRELISDFREDVGEAALKVFIYQINRCMCVGAENDEYWNRIRDAHRRLAYEDENIFTVASFGAELMEDKIHNSPSGCDLIGERMAATVLSKLYGFSCSCNTPIAESASLKNENEIEVVFNKETYFVSDNVNNRAFDFKIIDEKGEAEIKEITLKRNIALLKAERPILGNATVYGCYGSNPKREIPKDMLSGIPMAAFMLEA